MSESNVLLRRLSRGADANVVSEREKKFTTYAPSYVPDHIFYFLFKLNSTTDGIRLAPISAYCTFLSLGILAVII